MAFVIVQTKAENILQFQLLKFASFLVLCQHKLNTAGLLLFVAHIKQSEDGSLCIRIYIVITG